MPFNIIRGKISEINADYTVCNLKRFAGNKKPHSEEEVRSFYKSVYSYGKECNYRSIAVPVVSAEKSKFPEEEGLRIAIDEVNLFLLSEDIQIYLVVPGVSKGIFRRPFKKSNLDSYINRRYLADYDAPKEYQMVEARESISHEPKAMFRPYGGMVNNAKKSSPDEAMNRTAFEDSMAEPMCTSMFMGAAPEDAIDRLESQLSERMEHLSDTFSQYLLYLIGLKGLENSDVYTRAIVDKKVFSKIKNNPDYHPKKITALCLCVGAMLNIDETRDLLARAGYALSPCDKQDIIFSYFIENRIYDMIELDIQLEEHGLPSIIE